MQQDSGILDFGKLLERVAVLEAAIREHQIDMPHSRRGHPHDQTMYAVLDSSGTATPTSRPDNMEVAVGRLQAEVASIQVFLHSLPTLSLAAPPINHQELAEALDKPYRLNATGSYCYRTRAVLAEREVARLHKLLVPFASVASIIDGPGRSGPTADGFFVSGITLGDCRKALEVIKEAKSA